MKSIAAFVLFTLCWILPAQPETLIFAEGGATSQIAVAYKIFREMHGKEPKSWADIESIFDRPLNQTYKTIQPTIRYAFLDQPLVMPVTQAKIVILSRSPAHDQYKMRGLLGPIIGNLPSTLERYAIVIRPDGNTDRMAIPEAQIQKLFLEAGIPLPSPDPLGPRSYETANRLALYVYIGIALLLIGYAGYLLISRQSGGEA